MRKAILLQKIHHSSLMKEIEEFLRKLCRGLNVDLADFSFSNNEWIKLNITGDDEIIAMNLLKREIGLAPVSVENVERFSVIRGRIVALSQSQMTISVDIGVLSPKPIYAVVSLKRLQGQLMNGRKLALRKIAALCGIMDGLPFEVRILKAGPDLFHAELTEKQIGLFRGWIDMRVDRLIVLGASRQRVESAIRKARLKRDVIGVEPLGILEQNVICKLGTTAEGLVPKIGRLLRRARFAKFSPPRILKYVAEKT